MRWSAAPAAGLGFSTAVEAAIAAADMVFISVVRCKTKGLGAGQAGDLRWVEACARTVAQAATGRTIVVEKSTLPVRPAAIKTILEAAQQDDQGRSFWCSPTRSSLQAQSVTLRPPIVC